MFRIHRKNTPKITPKPGQESVWDYPRPPRLERTSKFIRIVFNGESIAETNKAYRVLETSHPPVYYIPFKDIKQKFLHTTSGVTYCEWKGTANIILVQQKSSYQLKIM
jgi:uncharacterized protein (DUF427 family)